MSIPTTSVSPTCAAIDVENPKLGTVLAKRTGKSLDSVNDLFSEASR